MAIPVSRVHLAMAHAALPGLLPTPPRAVVLPKQSPPPRKPAGRADAMERWDAQVKVNPSSSKNWSSNKRAFSRAASGERWDARKKQPRPVQRKELVDDDDKSSTGSNDVLELDTRPHKQAFYAGSGFLVSPEPGKLPVPSFMLRVA